MAEPRKAKTEHCSFCGEHKDDVPLIVTSQLNTQAACCSTCALTIVHQTHTWAYGIFNTVIKDQERRKALMEGGDNGDAAAEAIAKVSG
jgi:hypothetical protein